MAEHDRKAPAARQDNRAGRTPVVIPMRAVDTPGKEMPRLPIPRGKSLAVTRRTWATFWSSDLSQAVDPATDAHRLLRWITYVDEWHRAIRIYRENRMVEGSMGQVRVNPVWKTVSEIEQHLKAAEQELGLTPLARTRLGIEFGRAQLTAAELNRLAERRDDEEATDDGFADWEDADP